MTPRRRLLASASALLAVAALSGCERPSPIVTVVSGTTSEWKEADSWCFEGGECVEGHGEPVQLEVRPGETVGVDVGKDVVERGWFIELAGPGGEGQAQQSEVQEDRHYFSFTAPNVGEGAQLSVVALSEDGGSEAGRWVFELVPEA